MAVPDEAPLADIARDLRAGKTTARDLVERAIARHDGHGSSLGAYRVWDSKGARQAAAAADAALASGSDLGPLMGIPISVKDLYGVRGFDTWGGSPRPLPPSWDQEGPIVAALRTQSAVIVGKTQTVEFGFGGLGTNPHHATPRNPWDALEHRVPGGSSAGAGVSLIEGTALVALGTDTGGSCRIPAAWTGTVGLKVTAGRWSTDGIVPLSPTLDTPGILTRTVADAIWAFAAIDPRWSGPHALLAALTAHAPATPTIGVPREFFWDDAPADLVAVVEAALDELVAAGFHRIALELAEVDAAFAMFLSGGPAAPEFAEFMQTELPDWIPTLDANVAHRVGSAAALPEAEYRERLRALHALSESADRSLASVTVLAMPTVPIPPPTVAEAERNYRHYNLLSLRNTGIVNYLGLCAMSLPVGRDGGGLPVGLQLVARAGQEEALLRVALAAERILGTSRERLGEAPLDVA